MGAVVHLSFVGRQFVTSRNSHIDATPVRISFLMGVVGLLDGHVIAIDSNGRTIWIADAHRDDGRRFVARGPMKS